MGDEWLVQGSQGADYSYFLNVTSPIVIDITLCSANTTYDTKLEIFTADQDCNETTTGNYIDDATCEFSSLQSSLWGVSLSAGQYYIVVDGYGGQEGQYEINVTQSSQQANSPNDLLTNIALVTCGLIMLGCLLKSLAFNRNWIVIIVIFFVKSASQTHSLIGKISVIVYLLLKNIIIPS